MTEPATGECHVEVWHVRGKVVQANRVVCEFNLPVEAHDHDGAIIAATGWLTARRAFAIELDAHRCAAFENQVAAIVRGMLDAVRG